MFSRAAKKIETKEPVYPFTYLALMLAERISVLPKQLDNWRDILFCSLRKRYDSIFSTAIWNAVYMIIGHSVSAIKKCNYFAFQEVTYPVELLNIPGYVSESQQEPAMALNVLNQLKEKVKR